MYMKKQSYQGFDCKNDCKFCIISEFHLVVICNEEAELRSSMISSLERYRVASMPVAFSKSDIQEYLRTQFKAITENMAQVNKRPAAEVDFDKYICFKQIIFTDK